MSELIIESHKNATIIVLMSGCEQLEPHPFGQNMAATKTRDLTPAGTFVGTTLSNLWLWLQRATVDRAVFDPLWPH